MSDRDTDLLSLRVAADLASKFKVEAAQRGVRQNRLFEEILADYFARQAETGSVRQEGKP